MNEITNPRLDDFEVPLGHALDMGVFTMTPSSGDLVGSTAEMRIGEGGEQALVSLTSATPPATPSQFAWDENARTLAIKLNAPVLAPLPADRHSYQLTIVTSAGLRLPGGHGAIRVTPAPT
jgi:hypothetical protein